MRIVLGISGSIAACKAADLASQLMKREHEVHVVMTRSATEFITPLTLQTLTAPLYPASFSTWKYGRKSSPPTPGTVRASFSAISKCTTTSMAAFKSAGVSPMTAM